MKIAIVRLSALGDIIHSSIILQAIKKHLDVSIDWFVDERFAGILNSSLIDNVYALPIKAKKYKQTLSILKQARHNNYDAIIDAQGLIKSSIVARLLGKNIYGYDKSSAKEGLASVFYKHKLNISYDKNIVVRNLALASFMVNDFKNGVYKDNDEFLANSSFFNILSKSPYFDDFKDCKNYPQQDEKYILFLIGASVDNKMYDKKNFINLADKLNGFNIYLVWGNEKEFEIAKYINKYTTNTKILDKLSLKELSLYVKNALVVIGNDSGPTHLGFALNTPSITLFGPTPSERNTYTTNTNKVLKASNMDIQTNEICKCVCGILKLKGCCDG